MKALIVIGVTLVSSMLLFILSAPFIVYGSNETGEHTGFISDVSKAGWMCETLEGQVLTGEGNSAIHYEFTVKDGATFAFLKEAMHTKKKVILSYESPRIMTRCSSRFASIVTAARYTE